MLEIVLIVDITTASKLNSMVVAVEILPVCNMLGEIILKSINFKHNLLVGKEKLEVEVPIT